MATEAVGKGASDERLVKAGPFRKLLRQPEVGAIISAVAIWLIFALIPASRDTWLSLSGVARILDSSSTWGIMAVAVALLMIGGEFDLSTGVMTGTTGLIAGLLATKYGWNLWLGALAALVFALAVGLFNGWMVNATRLPSFIVTLATLFILRGANVGVPKILVDKVLVSGIDSAAGFASARAFFNTEFYIAGVGFRTTLIWWIIITIVATWILLKTKYGSWIFAVGGDANAARNVGVPAPRVKIALFMTTAAAAWLVGMTNIVRNRSAVGSEGVGLEFYYIIAAAVGGCLLTGGYGSTIGAAIGALIFGMAFTGIPFAGWPTDWYFSFLGFMLLVAVLLNNFVRKRATEMSVAAAKQRTETDKEVG